MENGNLYLYMMVIGCRPEGRLTEQHDVFFGIGEKSADLVPAIKSFWPEAKGKLHLDAYRKVTRVNGYSISIQKKKGLSDPAEKENSLFFINLGGYKPGEFEEYHYKIVAVAADKAEAIQQAKQTAFYRHYGFKGAESHIDDKYGIDVDEIHAIEDLLPQHVKNEFTLKIQKGTGEEDELKIGYFKLDKL